MRATYEWLKELVSVSASPREVSEKLTMIGLEVEGEETVEGDVVFEVNVTPNRPDCLSMTGIARELSAAFKTPLSLPPHEIQGGEPVSDFSVEILNPDLCNRYTGRVITGVKIADSPGWMKTRLEKCGIRSINNVVDVTNYVLLEFGHPLHAFDADLLKGRKIIVATAPAFKTNADALGLKAEADTVVKTLDGSEREISPESLLIWDSDRPVAVAGVMGGANTEVTERTVDVFLESAYFDPASIRKTAKRLGLASESSYRFERGTDIEFLEKALNRAALLIRETAGGTIHNIIDVYPVKYVPEPVDGAYERINRFLGIKLSKEEILEILGLLGLRAKDSGDTFTVLPPPYRRDVKRDSDVAEEVARIYGYNNIPITNPKTPLPSGRLKRRTKNIRIVREAMRKAGLTEVINFSFMSSAGLDMIGIPDADRRRNAIAVSNPLNQEEGLLRTCLVPALINNLKYNLDRGMKDIGIFELARIFEDIGNSLPLEELRVGGILYKEKLPALWREDAPGFYIVKGAVEALFEELKIGGYSFVLSGEPFLHAGQSADIYISRKRVGYIGVVSPGIVEKLDLKKQKPDIVVFEMNLDLLLSMVSDSMQYASIPKFPAVERDIALIVDESIPSANISEIVHSFPTELIEGVSVFDSFRGGNIPKGKKSLAFNIIYRSKERTLTDEEIESVHSSLVTFIAEKTGGELRR
ncbi:MAG TPA: phenylalanine--tRNA ligase subunit beta [Thermodesulfovibrionales bacterium]|nr:phenylalanine--tRNA ligase subunit beta [Thermodesulfovibrionales bacterium]